MTSTNYLDNFPPSMYYVLFSLFFAFSYSLNKIYFEVEFGNRFSDKIIYFNCRATMAQSLLTKSFMHCNVIRWNVTKTLIRLLWRKKRKKENVWEKRFPLSLQMKWEKYGCGDENKIFLKQIFWEQLLERI